MAKRGGDLDTRFKSWHVNRAVDSHRDMFLLFSRRLHFWLNALEIVVLLLAEFFGYTFDFSHLSCIFSAFFIQTTVSPTKVRLNEN